MYRDDDPDDAPVFYISVILALVVTTIYGIVALFMGEAAKGMFILTVSTMFYVALYLRFFPPRDNY